MRIRIATLIILFAAVAHGISAEDPDFLERFALASTPQRERLLDELVAGTEEHSYFHCLHYQNTRNTGALAQALTAWRVRDPQPSELRTEIELREAVLSYPEERERSLETLRRHFALDLGKIVPPPGAGIARDELTSKLDPADISPAAFLKLATETEDPLLSFKPETAAWFIGTKKVIPKQVTLRALLKKIERPDIPNLLGAIQKDLGAEDSGGFSSLPVHEQLLLPQLDALAKADLSLLTNQKFVNAYLRRLRPSPMEAGSELDQRRGFLERAWGFAKHLPPSMAATQAQILRRWLALDLQHGQINRERFTTYLKLPRKTTYMNPQYLRGCDNAFPLGLDLGKALGMPSTTADDEVLVRELFLTLFKPGANHEPFASYVRGEWLGPIFAEAQILAGKGNPERLFSLIDPVAYQKLVDRIDIRILPENKRHHSPEDEVTLQVEVKNVPKLVVKIFEINPLNYFLETGLDLDTSIDLDGLVATSEETQLFDAPPARRVRREFKFPQLTGKRGAWVIEFVGNGTSSRALIRKGELHAIPRSTAAGQAFKVFDADRQPVKGASIWLAGHEFTADGESGDILVPFSTKPGRTPFIISDGKLASFDHFMHEGEEYELNAGIFVDRESLIAGNTAQLIARPSLTINGSPASLALLQDVALIITSYDRDNTRSVERIEGVKFEAGRGLVHAFVVPEQLDRLEIDIEAKVESLSKQERVAVRAKKTIDVNQMDHSELIHSAHLIKSGDDYSVEILGKNGESQAGKIVSVSLSHRLFNNTVEVQLKSNENGLISLGTLRDITMVKFTVGFYMETWLIAGRDLAHARLKAMHLAAGESATIPTIDAAPQLDWERYSLLEMRGEVPVRNWFSALSVGEQGSIKISGLSAGEYRLETPAGSTVLLVSSEEPREILATNDQLLEHSRPAEPLGLEIEEPVDGKLRLKVSNGGKGTRVHVIASRYVSRFFFFWSLHDPIDQSPRAASILRSRNSFVSGREIGDEYRYILERRDRPKFPGNQLPRPGLILNPWSLASSSSGEGLGGGASMFFGNAGKKKNGGRYDLDDGAFRGAEESMVNLDFLTPQRRSFYQLVPDEIGVVEIDLKQLGNARFIRAIAINGSRSATSTRALPVVPLEKRDRRLQKIDQLDPRGRFIQARQAQVMQADQKVVIERSNTARYQIYDDLGDAFAMLNAIGGDATLTKFSFVINWANFEAEEKRRWYSDYACHELNLFLARHDPEFFAAVVNPYLINKREKDFIDHYLLGDDLHGYLDEWRLSRLNAAERAMLAQRLDGKDAKRCLRSLNDMLESMPIDNLRQDHLFETALAGHDLSTGDEARRFNQAMEEASLFPTDSSAGVEYIRRPLKSIIIPEIDFVDATLEDAIDFLRQQSKIHDTNNPTGGGVNIIIKPGSWQSENPVLINLQLTNVPLEDALKFTTELAGMKYKVDPLAVIIMPGYEEGGSILTQTFRVPRDFFEQLSGRSTDAKQALANAGVPFPDGTSATYLPRTSELVVRNTESNMDLIQVFVDSLIEDTSNNRGFAIPSDDPFAGGGAGGLSGDGMFPDGADDPFGGLDDYDNIAPRESVRQFYRKLGDTEELAETHYYQLPIAEQIAARIQPNAFWRDFAAWDGEGAFLSEHLVEASTSFSEIMLALSVIDLPFASGPAEFTQRGNELTITATAPAVVFVEQIRPAELADGDLVIGQKFYSLENPTRIEQGVMVPNYIDGDKFVIGTAYGSHIVATNPSGRRVQFDLLRQIPHGAIPLKKSRVTHSEAAKLPPFNTTTFTMGFYFPMAGKFAQYPVQASSEGKVNATTAGKTFVVAAERGEVDESSWDDLAARGSNDAVLEFLRSKNLYDVELEKIAWRMKDQAFFDAAIAALGERQIYHHELYSFGLAHDHPHAIRQFLLNSGRFLERIGKGIDSELLTVSPSERRLYQHLEYEPLINARQHQVGGESRIVNGQLEAQYAELMSLLAHKEAQDDDDRLSIVYYLLLQDRVGEAMACFDSIDVKDLTARVQYDYFRSYLAFYREQAADARQIALGYKDYPVERWRQLFAQVASQADEISGAGKVAIDDPRDREQQQDQLAATASHLNIEIADGQVVVGHRNLAEATLNFYKMDLEFLFSANPFVDSDTRRFRFIKPNFSLPLELALGEDGKQKRVELPEEFRNENVLVEVVGGGQSESQAYFANDLNLTIVKAYGRLQVNHSKSGKLLPKTYIKVYTRMTDGEIKFFKDGYTDLRGKFDYASISAGQPDIDDVERFAILVMHEDFGAVVKEIAPPNARE